MKKIRCASYTRKSSEEGLEQGFNSLDAQREACAVYVLSQASEGWNLLPEFYDDGGISGGTLERPALQRLLTDISAGRIDIVVHSLGTRKWPSKRGFELLRLAYCCFVSVF
jgi:DNA invertase Pin-like site-specific DNA recombinase